MDTIPKKNWHALSPEETARALQTELVRGLPVSEAVRRLEQLGRNELTETKPRSLFQRLADQFKDVMVWVLLAAVGVSVVLGEITDAIVIIAIVVLNAVLGVVQESKAEQSLEALKRMSGPRAHVVRDGQPVEIDSAEVVPGDRVLLEAGNFVPADLRLIEAAELQVDEASLTGESEPVMKQASEVLDEATEVSDRVNLAFAGTTVTKGRGAGLVIATGAATQVGDIARLLGEIREDKTPLQARLEQLGKTLAVAVLGVCAIVFVAGWLRGLPVLDMFLTSVSLAVAAIPEGLPAVVTIVLALGMSNMVRRHVITRRLRAVETLGSTTVICTDKTGTLTQNQMTVRRFWAGGRSGTVTGGGYAPEGEIQIDGARVDPSAEPALLRLLEIGALCNDASLSREGEAWVAKGDPTEAALIAVVGKAGLRREELEARMPRRAELPFDSDRKLMSTLHALPEGGFRLMVKGAPEGLLRGCASVVRPAGPSPITDEDRQGLAALSREMAEQALRVLGFAYRDFETEPARLNPEIMECDLVFVGLFGMIDPPREEARASIQLCRQAGIRPVMITGDHAVTARAIARELELAAEGDEVLTGREIGELSDEQLREHTRKTAVYARVSPAHKLRIVEAYQALGAVVAMTGDGVNDGPALKRADVGVAMGVTGTDVARGAADIVLTDDNFASIVAAVEEGRRIFDNIRKFVFYLLSCNISEILTLFIAVLIGLPQPLLPVQLLWLNLVTDGLPALALGLEPREQDVMRRPPRDPHEGVLTRRTTRGILWYGSFITLAALAAYAHGLYWKCLVPMGLSGPDAFVESMRPGFWHAAAAQPGLATARTMAFGTLAVAQLVHALNSRSAKQSLLVLKPWTNPHLLGAIVISGFAQILVINTAWGNHIFKTVPVGGWDLVVAVFLSLSPLLFGEVRKVLLRRADRRVAETPHGRRPARATLTR